jgi:membrane fusion protein, multidrug efflux system
MNETPQSKTRPRITFTRVIIVVIVLIVVLAVVKKRAKPIPPPPEKAMPVRVVVVQPQTIEDAINVPGRVEPFVAATLGTEKPGRIVERSADRGDRVEAGQVLLRIDDRSWKETLRQAQIENREAGKELARWEELQKAGAVSTSEFDRVQARKDLAEVALAQARVAVSQCEVRSPIDGIVDDRTAEVGEYATEGMPVFTVIDISRVKLVFDVPERDATAVKTGDRVPFRVAALPGAAFTGEVTFVSSLAGRDSNSFRVECVTDNGDGRLKAGMIADISLVRRMRSDAIVVPLTTVIPKRGDYVVYVVEGGKAAQRLVKVDFMTDRDAVIASGLAPGESVVVEGNRTLVDGIAVNVARDESAGTNAVEAARP